MAITESIGYGGDVDENDIPKWRQAFPGTYGVLDAGHCLVTLKTGLDRTVAVAPGVAYGHGIRDTNVGEVLVGPLTALTSGIRYDLIVVNRDFSGPGGVSTITKVDGVAGSENAAFTSRKQFAVDTVQDDQPLALVQVIGNAEGGDIGTIRDARVWMTNGGAYARDEVVIQYIDQVATSILIGRNPWNRIVGDSGSAAWTRGPGELLSAWDPAEAIAPSLGARLPSANAKVTLTAGIWIVNGSATVRTMDVSDQVACALQDASSGIEIPGSRSGGGVAALTSVVAMVTRPVRITVASPITVQVVAIPNGASTVRLHSSAASPTAWISAQRVG